MLLNEINKVMVFNKLHWYVFEYFLLMFEIAWAFKRNKVCMVIVLVSFSGSLIAIFSEGWLKPTIRINPIKIGISCLDPIIWCFTGHKNFDHYEIKLIYSCNDPRISSQWVGNGCWHSPKWLFPRPDIVVPTARHCRSYSNTPVIPFSNVWCSCSE